MPRPTPARTALVALLLSLSACAPDRGFVDDTEPSAADGATRDAARPTIYGEDVVQPTTDPHDASAPADRDASAAPDDAPVTPPHDAGVATADAGAHDAGAHDAGTHDAGVSAGTCACDPVGQTGCGAGLACYIVNIEFEYVGTVCATPGTGGMYDSCANPNDCAPGLGCVGETPSIGFSGMCYGMCNPSAGVPPLCSSVGRNLCNTSLHTSPCVGVCDADISGS